MIFADSGLVDTMWKELAYLAIFAGVLVNGIYNMMKYQQTNKPVNGNAGNGSNGHPKVSDKDIKDIISSQSDHNVDIIDRLNDLAMSISKIISLQERILELQKDLINQHSETMQELRNLTRVLSERHHSVDIAHIMQEIRDVLVTTKQTKKIV